MSTMIAETHEVATRLDLKDLMRLVDVKLAALRAARQTEEVARASRILAEFRARGCSEGHPDPICGPTMEPGLLPRIE